MKIEELSGKSVKEAWERLEDLTVMELKEICRENFRRGYSRMTKESLKNEVMMAAVDMFLLKTEPISWSEEDTEDATQTIEEGSPMTQTTERKTAASAMREIAVMNSAGDANDTTRFWAITKVLKGYTLAVLKEINEQNGFGLKDRGLRKEYYVFELAKSAIRTLASVDNDENLYVHTPLGELRRAYLDGKLTYVESGIRDESVIRLCEKAAGQFRYDLDILEAWACVELYELITSTPESHAFRNLTEEQKRIMRGFTCQYNDRGIKSGLSAIFCNDLNIVEVKDPELAAKCFAEYLRNKYEPAAVAQPAPEAPASEEAPAETPLVEISASKFREMPLREKYAWLTRIRASEAGCYVYLCSESEADAMTRMLEVNPEHYRVSSVQKLLTQALEVREVRGRVEYLVKDGATADKVSAYLNSRIEDILEPLAREAGMEVMKDTPMEEIAEYLTVHYLGTAEHEEEEIPPVEYAPATLVDVCAGVENYECGKLCAEELTEILGQASAATLREYILKVIVPDKGRKDAA